MAGETAEREPQVEVRMNRLGLETIQLMWAVENLEARLVSVASPYECEESLVKTPYLVPHARELQIILDVVMQCRIRLRSLVQRLRL